MSAPDRPNHLQDWQVLSRDLVVDCPPWLSLWKETVRLPDGREIRDYLQLDQPDYVEIVAWQAGKVLGLWRYKHGPRRMNLGFPAGYVAKGENPADAARRELREETGMESDAWRSLGTFCVDGNRTQARAHLFTAQHCRFVGAQTSDDLEVHVAEWLTPQQWGQYLAEGWVATLGTAMAVYAGILVPFQQSCPIESGKDDAHDY